MAKHKKTKKFWIRVILITTLALIVLAVVGKKSGWFGDDIGHKVACTPVEKHTIMETVTANGKVQPETEVKISPDVSGEIIELNIKEGEQVEEGDFLLKIKPDIYESNLDRAEAALNSAKPNLANACA